MALSMKELKTAVAAVEAWGLSHADSLRVICLLNTGTDRGREVCQSDHETIKTILAGDLSRLPDVCGVLGIVSPVKNNGAAGAGSSAGPVGVPGGSVAAPGSSSDKISASPKKTAARSKSKQKNTSITGSRNAGGAAGVNTGSNKGVNTASDDIRTEGDIIPAGVSSSGLPEGFGDRVEGWLSDFSMRYDIALDKASGQQWRSACLYVGQNVQRSGVLLDYDRLRREGGSKIYKPEAVVALMYVWEYFTGLYKHIPLASDFIAFSGVSREWFYDSQGQGLTSSRLDILQKAKQIEECGLSAGLVDGRENPTGRIYYTKARLGWRESVEIVHKSEKTTADAVALPVFGENSGLIEDKTN